MSDDRDWRQYTRRGALGLIGVGAFATVSETLGVTQVVADRDIAFSVRGDDNAGIEILATDGEPFDSSNSSTLSGTTFENEKVSISFGNQFGEPLDGDALSEGSGLAVEVDPGQEITVRNGSGDEDFSPSSDTSFSGTQTFSTDLPTDGDTAVLVFDSGGTNDINVDLTVVADTGGASIEVGRSFVLNESTN